MAPEQLIAIAELLAESGAASAATLEARLAFPPGRFKGIGRRSRPLGCVIARWMITGVGRAPLNGCPWSP